MFLLQANGYLQHYLGVALWTPPLTWHLGPGSPLAILFICHCLAPLLIEMHLVPPEQLIPILRCPFL